MAYTELGFGGFGREYQASVMKKKNRQDGIFEIDNLLNGDHDIVVREVLPVSK